MENKKKPRLLLVLKMLQRTDVEHPLNTTEIINNLKQCGVDAERKAVLENAETEFSKPFKYAEDLQEKLRRQFELNALLDFN